MYFNTRTRRCSYSEVCGRAEKRRGLFEILEMEECKTSVSPGNCLICGTRVMLRGGMRRWLVLSVGAENVQFGFCFTIVESNWTEPSEGVREEEREERHREGAGKRLRGERRIQKDDYEHTHDCARTARVLGRTTITFRQIIPCWNDRRHRSSRILLRWILPEIENVRYVRTVLICRKYLPNLIQQRRGRWERGEQEGSKNLEASSLKEGAQRAR